MKPRERWKALYTVGTDSFRSSKTGTEREFKNTLQLVNNEGTQRCVIRESDEHHATSLHPIHYEGPRGAQFAINKAVLESYV